MGAETPDIELLVAQTGWLRNLARRLVGDADRADDVAQEAILTALERPPRGAGDPRVLRAWLARVVRRGAQHDVRAERRRAHREAEAARPEAGAEDAGRIVARADTARALAETVLALPEPHRSLLVLRYFEGRSTAEIADELDITPANVRARLSRAHARLREALDRENGGRRDAWLAALAPIAGVDAPRSAAPTKALVSVAFLMKLTTAAAAAAIVLLAAFTSLRSLEDPKAIDDSVTAAPNLETTTPLEPTMAAVDSVATRADVAPTPLRDLQEREPLDSDAALIRPRLVGRVIDENDAPIPGALVEVAWGYGDALVPMPGSRPQEASSTVSDDEGRYEVEMPRRRRLTELRSSSDRVDLLGSKMVFRVRAIAAGFTAKNSVVTYPEEAPEQLELDVHLLREQSELEKLVSIQVHAPSGLNRENAKIELLDATTDELEGTMALRMGGRTDSDGICRFAAPPDAPFVAVATLASGVSGWSAIIDPASDPLKDITIRLGELPWISGTVRDSSGLPLPMGQVDVVRAEGEGAPAKDDWTTTPRNPLRTAPVSPTLRSAASAGIRPDGRFEIGELESGDYWLRLPDGEVVGPVATGTVVEETCDGRHRMTLRIVDEDGRMIPNPMILGVGEGPMVFPYRPNELGEIELVLETGTWTFEARYGKARGTSREVQLPGHGNDPVEITVRID